MDQDFLDAQEIEALANGAREDIENGDYDAARAKLDNIVALALAIKMRHGQ